ncbi:hypothetical protein TI39_contig4182g00007 [Zymoseptoria brevis]|uniref:Uncharacterized protein n=1 Tax=Zymoseptoria brevis TaxID=1047168 RepID=A0A0F4GAW9_9PEZI|nr:hypothetical protein TI39_contig4182g00007 [Zymoseptoria brevis]
MAELSTSSQDTSSSQITDLAHHTHRNATHIVHGVRPSKAEASHRLDTFATTYYHSKTSTRTVPEPAAQGARRRGGSSSEAMPPPQRRALPANGKLRSVTRVLGTQREVSSSLTRPGHMLESQEDGALPMQDDFEIMVHDDSEDIAEEYSREQRELFDNPFRLFREKLLMMAAKLVDGLNPLHVKSREELAEMFRSARALGGEHFARFIYDQEIVCSTLQGAEITSALHEAWMYYISYFPEIIDGLIQGDLPARLADPNSLAFHIEQLYRQRATEVKKHPGIYLNVITDD